MGISNKEVIQQSNCFIFKNNQITTYNDAISVSVPFQADFECAVPAIPLTNALSKYTGDEVEMNVENGELHLSCGRRRNGIKIHNEITIPLQAVQPPEEYDLVHPDFATAIGMVVHSCGNNPSEYVLTCVHITDKVVEACDRFQITTYNIETGFKEEFLLPSDCARMLSKLSITHAKLNNKWLYCKVGDIVYACRTYQENYPNLNQIIQEGDKKLNLPNCLKDIINGAVVFTDSTSAYVNIKIEDGKMVVRSENDSGWFEEATEEVDYDGAVSFVISPQLLTALLKHSTTCKVSPNMLVAQNEYYTHVACLQV